MPEKTAAPKPRFGLLLRLLRILAWLLILIALAGVALYLAFGPARLIDRLKPPQPAFPEQVTASPDPVTAAPVPAAANAPDDTRELIDLVMGSVEDIWGEFLARGDYVYRKPRLELYEGRVEAACKQSGAASGPFYCAEEKRIYLDLTYLEELRKRVPEVGDFALTYVVAHEAAHHVQNLLGTTAWIKEYGARGEMAEGPKSLEEAQELLADCLVGSWASYAQRKYPWLKPPDIEKALKAVAALSDERTRRQGQPPMRDPLTLGSIQARTRWFMLGVESGDARECSQLFGGVAQ
ncbi:neutral zinc metallopeptidase [Pseudomonas sp. GCM10022186]|uniref:neutral zinc metallopeptidase n=1 Tax=Pseudomonas sp. GCM10022186 TaxID=3252650 RepID=UPI00361A7208